MLQQKLLGFIHGYSIAFAEHNPCTNITEIMRIAISTAKQIYNFPEALEIIKEIEEENEKPFFPEGE